MSGIHIAKGTVARLHFAAEQWIDSAARIAEGRAEGLGSGERLLTASERENIRDGLVSELLQILLVDCGIETMN